MHCHNFDEIYFQETALLRKSPPMYASSWKTFGERNKHTHWSTGPPPRSPDLTPMGKSYAGNSKILHNLKSATEEPVAKVVNVNIYGKQFEH
jgi:hypothetical protein